MRKSLIVLVFITALGMTGCAPAVNTSSDASSESAINAMTVDVITAKSEEIDGNLTYKGTILPSELAVVSTKASGKVEQILFENGDMVQAGAPLIILDKKDYQFQLSQARNQLAASQSQYQIAKNQADVARTGLDTVRYNYDRTKLLYEAGAISKMEFENMEMTYKKAQGDSKSADSGVNAAQVGIRNANTNIAMLNDIIANTVVKAPIAGMVDEKMVVLGQFAAPEAGALAKIKVTTPIHAIIQVQQDDLSSITQGLKADVNFDGQHFEGVVKTIDASASLEARTFNVRIEIPNETLALKPGVFVEVAISTGAKQKGIMVPIQVLSGTQDNYAVFVYKEGVARKVSVETGTIKDNRIEILSGIQEGDKIITTNLSTIQDGYQVNAKEGA